jgi:cytochrome c-type biogenesis protein CcmH
MEKMISLSPLWLGILVLAAFALIFLLLPLFKAKEFRNKKHFLLLFIPFYLSGVLALYHYWGASSKVADQIAIDKINNTLVALSQDTQLDPNKVVTTFKQLETELGYSDPALAKLGNLYLELSLHDAAIACFDKAHKKNPQEGSYQEQWIYSHSLRDAGKLPTSVRQLAENVVATHPHKYNLINLLAIDDYFRGNYEKAVFQWQHLLSNDPDLKPEQLTRIQSAIKTAQEKMPGVVKSILKVKVGLNQPLKLNIKPEETVFLFVRQKNGSKMPLAVLKKRVSDLPFVISLDDTHMMIEGSQFIAGTEVEVVAKISKSGDALNKQGDILSKSESCLVKEGETFVELLL